MIKFISCFSGIEAASVASSHLGWQAVAFSEIDKFASAVLAHHFPNVPNLGDITKVNWSLYAGSVGLVCGGSPCQAFSVAGLRKSLEDPRGNLTIEFMRAVHDIKPKWVMWENVPGTFSAAGNPFGCFVAGLAGYDSAIEPTSGKWASSGFLVAKDEDSYSLAWRVLDAQYFGVPQRRRRIFLVGHLGKREWWKPLEVLFERSGAERDSSESGKAREEVAGNAGSCVEAVGFTPSQFGQYRNGCGTLRANGGDFGGGSETLVMAHGQGGAEVRGGQAPCLTCNHEAPILAFNWQSGGYCRLGPCEDQANTLQRCQTQAVAFAQNTRNELRLFGGDGGIVGALAARPGMKQTSYLAFAQNQEGELRTSKIANTVTTTGNASARGTGKLLSGSVVRRLTPTECERLQGFPDNWTRIPYRGKPAEKCPDGPRYKALGNSWAVPCARWIFERINKVDKL